VDVLRRALIILLVSLVVAAVFLGIFWLAYTFAAGLF
jgi:hypothetical protein